MLFGVCGIAPDRMINDMYLIKIISRTYVAYHLTI